MASDGQLAAQSPQLGFAQSYVAGRPTNDGGPAIFGDDAGDGDGDGDDTQIAPVSITASILQPAILTALQETALRYGGHAALRQAGLSVSDWLTLFQANIEVESAYRPTAVSSAGAIGLGQLMPGTARDLGVDPHDTAQNLDGSARYLLAMLARFGTPELALAAYNAGPDAVARHGGIPPFTETQNHVRRVMAVRDRLIGAS
ncbi:putative lytic transglycosylase [Octadecabacter arcticus 238]|uniref:Putative lytic transglycosylase n=1 Tax=Octadecabacter arcticus 238 TaxID=391616 RepID=M9RMV6_9RHOB|nr:lytic transglycosylase domain-containing protein [Octadecabacter arcticus]AGI71140.1 putative lytic transglycosylase [Octadecabacter arcticus 238]